MTDQLKVTLLVMSMFIVLLFITAFRGATEIDTLIATQDSLRHEIQDLHGDLRVLDTKILIIEGLYR